MCFGCADAAPPLRYIITSPPALGTLWLENRFGAIACVVTSETMCEGIGENNIFSYLPAPDVQNFEDSFSYKVDDCVKPRTSHTECFEAASTIWVRTGAFQGTNSQEEEARCAARDPPSRASARRAPTTCWEWM